MFYLQKKKKLHLAIKRFILKCNGHVGNSIIVNTGKKPQFFYFFILSNSCMFSLPGYLGEKQVVPICYEQCNHFSFIMAEPAE